MNSSIYAAGLMMVEKGKYVNKETVCLGCAQAVSWGTISAVVKCLSSPY